jgi:hypothetical protein
MRTLQIMSNANRTYSVGVGSYAPGPDPRVHGQQQDLTDMLLGIQRRHSGLAFATEVEAEGALSAAYLARLAGIRS